MWSTVKRPSLLISGGNLRAGGSGGEKLGNKEHDEAEHCSKVHGTAAAQPLEIADDAVDGEAEVKIQ
jgi:hypothetical protein